MSKTYRGTCCAQSAIHFQSWGTLDLHIFSLWHIICAEHTDQYPGHAEKGLLFAGYIGINHISRAGRLLTNLHLTGQESMTMLRSRYIDLNIVFARRTVLPMKLI